MKEHLKPISRNFKKKSSFSLNKGLHYQQREAKRQNMNKSTIRQAEELRFSLKTNHPTFTKYLLWSHVASCFWMGLPHTFCKMFLPQQDTYYILEDPNGKQYRVKYLARKTAFSGGWRGFSLAEDLSEGDAMVFQLVQPEKFKVYIIRANSGNEVNRKKCVTSKGDSNYPVVYKKGEAHRIAESYKLNCKRLTSNNEGSSMSFRGGILFSDISSFEEFQAAMHKLLQFDELPNCALHDYYELCFSQNAFLHANLFVGVNPRFNSQTFIGAIKRIILNIVSIANALSTCDCCKLSTFLQQCDTWDLTLKTYDSLGMNVSFLLDRLHCLKSLALNCAADKNKYIEASRECGCAKDEVRKLDVILLKLHELAVKYPTFSSLKCVKAEVRKLEAFLDELGKVFCHYDAHIEALKLKIKNHERAFQEEVSAPW